MNNHHFYFWSNLELTEYDDTFISGNDRYRFSSDVEDSFAKTGISFALGLIVTLIIFGTAQLYSSLNTSNSSVQGNRVSKMKLNYINPISIKKGKYSNNTNIEAMTVKNTVAKGKF